MLKCTVGTREFQEVIKRLDAIINKKAKIPAIKNILIRVDNDKVEVIGTDLKNFVIANITSREVIQEGDCVITNTKELIKSFKFMKEHQTVLEQNADGITIENGSRKIKVATMDSDVFPIPPKLNTINSYDYHTKQLYDRIKKIDFALSKDNTRPPLTGIRFQGGDMVALDGYRLALSEDNSLDIQEPFTLCKEAVDFIVKTTRTVNESMTIEKAEGHVVFKFDNITLIAGEIEGTFFDYKKIIPNDLNNKFKLNTKKLREDIEFLNVYMSTKDAVTEMNITKNNVKLKVNNENGIFTTDKEVNTGFDLDIAFNGKYMLDNLKVINTEELTLGFNGRINPIFIQGNEGEKYILLPIRLPR